MADAALNTAQILWDEREALRGRPLPSARPPNELKAPIPDLNNKAFADLETNDLGTIYQTLNGDNRWALCLSGGGIRSAAFALGVVQCFAGHRVISKHCHHATEAVLKQFDYLSTVSGGGYVGSWLSAWLFQERKYAGKGGANAVLSGLNARVNDHQEVQPINNLRRDSHYLAPSFSALSPDVWSDIATMGRNLVLNWVLLVPPMFLSVLVTKALAYEFADALDEQIPKGLTSVAAVVASLLLTFALAFAVANRPNRALINRPQADFLIYDLGVFLVGSVILVFVLSARHGREQAVSIAGWITSWVTSTEGFGLILGMLTVGATLGLAVYLVSWLAACLWQLTPRTVGRYSPEHRAWHTLVDLGAWCLAGLAFGALTSTGCLLFQWIVTTRSLQPDIVSLVALAFGIPGLLMARIIADVVFIAPVEFIPRSDGDLEYQARAGGIYTLALIGWALWFGLVLFGLWLEQTSSNWVAAWLAGAGGVSGAIALVIGSGSKTSPVTQAAGAARRYLSLNNLASIAAAIFAAVLVVSISIIMDWGLQPKILANEDGPSPLHPQWARVCIAAAVLLVIVVAVPWVININRFSLHGLYRNRLMRAFLGAPRRDRESSKNQFTDFDTCDSPKMHELWEPGVAPRGDNWKPLHLINVALNLVSSKNLAWQERLAAPFTFSPLHAGSGSSAFDGGAFRRSYPLGQHKPYGGRLGLTLGTAMAISGAAVSPSMGYNSSPGVSFLMALFNVRLGWWLGNPRPGNSHYWYTGPGWALRPFFMEMFGLTSETESWVYLSDGGHFENLGFYEMVRRRCRVIVVCDAGCDADYQFEDLGNALRKIWIDLGVQIDFVGLDLLKKRFKERPTPASNEPYWAVGRIRYKKADRGNSVDGLLLYVKSGLHGSEPMDVISYALAHPSFPHESTAHQFFNESQFEGYRMLGHEIATNALCYAEREAAAEAAPATERKQVQSSIPRAFDQSDSTMTLNRIIERLETQLTRVDSNDGNGSHCDGPRGVTESGPAESTDIPWNNDASSTSGRPLELHCKG